MNMHELMEQDVPLVYDLSYDPDGLLISVCPEVADAVETIFIHALTMNRNDKFKSRVTGLSQELGLPQFTTPFSKMWGYKDVIQTVRETGSVKSIVWKVTFPDRCLYPEDCIEEFHRVMLCVSASLQLLFRVLHIVSPPKGEEKKQLVMVNGLMTQLGQNGSALSVTLSKALCEFLVQNSQHAEEIQIMMRDRMITAYNTLMQREVDESLDHYFRTKLKQGSKFVYLSCPGNACGLTPDERADENDTEGYELLSHNTDSPIQQVILLRGIAALCGYVRYQGVN